MNHGSREEAEAGVDALLRFLGLAGQEGTVETPRRVVAAYAEMTAGYDVDVQALMKTFPDECDEMVTVKNIPFSSLCEHHLLPFVGRATVGYIPNGRVIGLSKIPRLVDVFARRLQLQERLTRQIADTLHSELRPLGVGVIVEAEHQCMSCRGVNKQGASMVTSSFYGAFRDNHETRNEFLTLARAER